MKDAAQRFIKGEMHKYKIGTLHSGSSRGPVVKSRQQAIAIALSQSRKKGLRS